VGWRDEKEVTGLPDEKVKAGARPSIKPDRKRRRKRAGGKGKSEKKTEPKPKKKVSGET